MNLSMKGSRISMSLAESTNVQVYISQVFVGQRQQMDVFWKMQETAFSRKTIVKSTPKDHKKKHIFSLLKALLNIMLIIMMRKIRMVVFHTIANLIRSTSSNLFYS